MKKEICKYCKDELDELGTHKAVRDYNDIKYICFYCWWNCSERWEIRRLEEYRDAMRHAEKVIRERENLGFYGFFLCFMLVWVVFVGILLILERYYL